MSRLRNKFKRWLLRPSPQTGVSHILPQISTLPPLDIEDVVINRRLTAEECAPIHYAFSPLGRLPTELLQNVFLYVTEPSTLLLVCKYWQRVAVKFSPLWETVIFDPAKHTSQTAAFLLRQLESGRYRPINLDIAGWPRWVERKTLRQVVRHCLKNLQHTQQLSINLNIKGSAVAFGELVPMQDAPELRDFRLRCEDPWMDDYISVELPLLKATKSLKHVEFWRFPLEKSPVSLVNLHSLAIHRLPDISPTAIADLIKRNPGLKSFSVVYSTSGWPWDAIEFPVLERFTLSFVPVVFPLIIGIFKAPKLQHLYLTTPFDRLSVQHILEPLPLANLRTLHLTSTDRPLFLGTGLHPVIEKCTSLVNLTLCDPSCDPQPIITWFSEASTPLHSGFAFMDD